jgi:hypothetical protein
MNRTVLVLASLAVLTAGLASGQETTGAVIGTVRSQDQLALPGVTVQVIDALRGLERTVMSGRDGSFRIVALPPSEYELTATMPAFQTVKRPVRVALGSTVTSDIEMQVGAVTDVIEVTAERPQVDPTSTVTGLTVVADDLNARVPVQREITQVALLAPGTAPAPRYYEQAGSTALYTPGQGFASFSGASIGENSFQVNGLNITNFRNGLGSSFVPMVFVQEVQVKTGGYEAEFGRSTGGVVNLVTKSGSNTLRGGLSAFFEPEALQEQEPDTFWFNNQDETRQELEANASIGGPIVRDSLFFFAFARYSDTAVRDVYGGHTDLHETSAPYWGAKLDWNLTANHRLEGTYFSDQVDVHMVRSNYDPETRQILDPWATGVRIRGGDNVVLRYTGVLRDNLLLAAQAGRNDFDRTLSSDGDECPRAWDDRPELGEYVGCWAWNGRRQNQDTRNAYRLDMDWHLGNHSLRAGVDYELNEALSVEEYSGGVAYTYVLNGWEGGDPEDFEFPELPWDQELVWVEHYRHGGVYETNSNAAYVQDSWMPRPHLTVNLGLRWERYENKNPLGETFIETNDQWAPRLGVIWDPSGQGRSKLFASYGVYHLPVPAATNILHAGGYHYDEAWYIFDGVINPDGSPSSVGEELRSIVWADGETPDPRATIAENFDPMAQNEVILGYERMLGDTWSVGIRGVGRWFDQVIEDYSIDQGLWNAYGVECLNPDLLDTDQYCYGEGWRLGNPGRDFEGWFDLDRDGVLDPVYIPADTLGYPEAERDHFAVELTVNRRFADGWMLRGAYTWSHTYGNYGGTINDDTGSLSPGMSEAFDTPGMMDHSSGNLPQDRRHNIKIFGAYRWNFGLQVGANAFFQNGQPFNSFGRHPTDPWARAWGNSSFFTGGEPRPRGCCGTVGNSWSLDLMLGYGRTTAGIDWDVRLDVFNVFNTHGVLWADHYAEDTGDGEPNELYGETLYYQTPRSVRFGLRLSF